MHYNQNMAQTLIMACLNSRFSATNPVLNTHEADALFRAERTS